MPTLAEGTRARTESIRVKLSAEMLQRLEGFAIDYGMPSATMAAFAVADWITKQESNQKMTRMAILEATRQGMTQFSGEAMEKAMEKAMESALPAVALALASSGQELSEEGQAMLERSLTVEGSAE